MGKDGTIKKRVGLLQGGCLGESIGLRGLIINHCGPQKLLSITIGPSVKKRLATPALKGCTTFVIT